MMQLPTGEWNSYVLWQLRRHGELTVDEERLGGDSKPSFLRIERQGGNFIASYSHDGEKWESFPKLEVDLTKKLRVGVTAIQNTPGGYEAVFEYFKTVSRP